MEWFAGAMVAAVIFSVWRAVRDGDEDREEFERRLANWTPIPLPAKPAPEQYVIGSWMDE